MAKEKKVDKFFLTITLLLVSFGFLVFYSAATGLVVRGNNYTEIIMNQLIFGLAGGLFVMWLFSYIDHNFFKKYSLIIFSICILLTIAVFIPDLGIKHRGSTRWLDLGFASFQPSELLKISSIMFIAAWFNYHKSKVVNQKLFAFYSIITIIALIALPLIFQRDFDLILLIGLPLVGIYFVSKAPWKTGLLFIIGAIMLVIIMAIFVPHIKSRIMGYIKSDEGGQSINYQAQQSLIAIGSGGIFGKGFGKSTQKFGNLPEPTSDSVFAVLAEEFGLWGSSVLIILYILFAISGYRIAMNANSVFGSLFVFGIISLIILQSFLNIGSMLGLLPITGQPLVFVSHGGTSLLVTLFAIGIILNISKNQKQAN